MIVPNDNAIIRTTRPSKPGSHVPKGGTPIPSVSGTLNIDLKGQSRKGKELSDIIGQMDQVNVGNADDEDDLLALMDKAK